jgi:DNA-binding beta-propeller fold protein YncE
VRFRYAGELTGEQNFKALPGSTENRAVRALRWIAGLGRERKKPVVLQRPQGGAVDADGRVFVTDVSRAAVFVFDPAAGRLAVWSQATDESDFVAPIGVALGEDGEILVSDAELGIVVRLSSAGKPLGEIGRNVLVRPTGIARDPSNNRIYVADTRANDIKVFDSDGSLLALIGHEGDALGALNAPTYLTIAGDRVYVVDSLNSRVQVFDREGDLVKAFGERGLYVGNFTRPKGIAVGPRGQVYVVESYHDHLLVFDDDGQFLLPIGGTGRDPGQFYLPAGVWTDSGGLVYVADMFNGRVSIFEPVTSDGGGS